MAPGVDEDGQRQPAALAPREPFERLLGLLAGEQEAAEQRPRLARRQAGQVGGRLEHRPGRAGRELLGVLAQVADLDVVAGPELALDDRSPGAALRLAAAGQRLDQRGLARAVGADQRHVLAALEPQFAVVEQQAVADRHPAVLELEHHPTAALRGLEGELQPGAVGRPLGRAARSSASFLARDWAWRARVPARNRVTNRSSRSISACWRSIARPSASSRAAFSLRQACQGPGKNLPRPASSSSTEVPTASRNQRSWATSTTAASSAIRCCSSHSSEAMSRWLVGSSSSSRSGHAGQRAAQRGAGQLAAGERAQRAVEIGVVAEAEAVQGGQRPLAPAVAAGMLEPGLGLGVAVERRLVVGPAGHRGLELASSLLDRHQLPGAGEDVVPERDVALARGALVVEGDLGPLGQHELALVDRGLPGQHPQQRRLAGAVAAGQGHPVAALELERDAAQQRLPGHVLAEVGCDHDGHRFHGRPRWVAFARRMKVPPWAPEPPGRMLPARTVHVPGRGEFFRYEIAAATAGPSACCCTAGWPAPT